MKLRSTADVALRGVLMGALMLAMAGSGKAWTPGDLPRAVDDSYEIDISEALASKAYTSPVVVPAAAFSNNGGDADCYLFPFIRGYLTVDDGESGCFYAPVYLPNDALIDHLQANVYDNSPTMDLFVGLYQVNIFTGAAECIGTLSSTGADTGLHLLIDSSITQASPSPSFEFNYFVGTCLYDTMRLYQVSIYYTQPDASMSW